MAKARKEHKCILCYGTIPVGSEHVSRRVPPWECGDGDPMWYTYRAHQECNNVWGRCGGEFDWSLPMSKGEWQDVLDHDRTRAGR